MKDIMLTKLQEDLFEMMGRIMTKNQHGTLTKEDVEGHLCFNELAKTAVTNGALIAKCADMTGDHNVLATLPLIPLGQDPGKIGQKAAVVPNGKRPPLFNKPKDGEE